jgi:outer membrane immunogenic protein
MRKVLSLVGATLLFASSALAADLGVPVKAPAAMPLMALNWAGFYIGGYAGYGWGNSDTTGTLDPNSAFGNAPPVAQPAYNANMSPSLKPAGFTGGGTIGVNQQTGAVVWGIEGDFGAFHLSDSATTSVTPPGHVNLTSVTTVNTDWLGTVRGRLGWAFGSSLIYGTGGVAFTNLNFHQVNSYAIGLPGSVEDFSISDVKAGWTVGAGLEHMFAPKWSAKIEYLYMDFGSVNGTGVVPVQPVNVAHSANLTANVVRAGINFHF